MEHVYKALYDELSPETSISKALKTKGKMVVDDVFNDFKLIFQDQIRYLSYFECDKDEYFYKIKIGEKTLSITIGDKIILLTINNKKWAEFVYDGVKIIAKDETDVELTGAALQMMIVKAFSKI